MDWNRFFVQPEPGHVCVEIEQRERNLNLSDKY